MSTKTKTKKISRDKLFEQYYPLVKAIARKYSSWNEPVADLEQVGAMGLMKAMERYSKRKGKNLSVYAGPTIDGEIRHYIRDKAGSVKISRKWIELNAKVNKYLDSKRAAYGKKVSVGELAKNLKVKAAKIEKAKDAVNTHFTTSLADPVYALQGTEANVVTMEDMVGEKGHADQVLDKIYLEDAMAKLPERHQDILKMVFFEDAGQEDVAKRAKVTQAQVSRIIKQSIDQLKDMLA